MAQDVRSRPVGLAGALLLSLAACRDAHQPAVPSARAVDTAALDAATLPGVVLDECHAPLRGKMDRVEATIVLPDGQEVRAYAAFPERLRLQEASGQFLARGDEVLRIGGNQPAAAASPEERARVLQLRQLLDAAALGPLHRATGCRRTGEAEFELTQPGGDRVQMALRPGTLLPATFTDRSGTVALVEWQRTTATWLVALASTPALGACRVRFTVGDIAWANDFFSPPEARPAPAGPQQLTDPGVVVERQSATPILVDSKVLGQVLVRDPGDWAKRAAAYAPLHAELERQGQQIAGFPQLWQQDGQGWLAAPFRQRAGGPRLQAPADWTVREIAAGRWLVVYPAEGDFAARIATGERLLQAALQERGLRARGPIVAQPWLHLEEGAPDDAAIGKPKVRVAVPVQ